MSFAGAAYSPPEIRVLPPTDASFSTRITSAPASLAETAAAKPAPPPPITTTSVSFSTVSPFFSSPSVSKFFTSLPLASIAALTASITAVDVTVAPETVSTLIELFATISSTSLSAALSPRPSVSSWVRSIFAILSPSKVTTDVYYTQLTLPTISSV